MLLPVNEALTISDYLMAPLIEAYAVEPNPMPQMAMLAVPNTPFLIKSLF